MMEAWTRKIAMEGGKVFRSLTYSILKVKPTGFTNVECQRKSGNKSFAWAATNIEHFLRCGRLYKEGIVSEGMEDAGGESRV